MLLNIAAGAYEVIKPEVRACKSSLPCTKRNHTIFPFHPVLGKNWPKRKFYKGMTSFTISFACQALNCKRFPLMVASVLPAVTVAGMGLMARLLLTRNVYSILFNSTYGIMTNETPPNPRLQGCTRETAHVCLPAPPEMDELEPTLSVDSSTQDMLGM